MKREQKLDEYIEIILDNLMMEQEGVEARRMGDGAVDKAIKDLRQLFKEYYGL